MWQKLNDRLVMNDKFILEVILMTQGKTNVVASDTKKAPFLYFLR